MKSRPGFAILVDSDPLARGRYWDWCVKPENESGLTSTRLHVEPEPVAPGLPGSTQSKLLYASRSARGDESTSRTRATLDILHSKCAGLDVHKKTVVACLRSVDAQGRVEKQTRTFGTMTGDLLELSDWLASEGVQHAAMESTGVYWKPIWHILEGRFELMLVNAHHMKQVPGRKTDVKDAEWIAQLLQHGLLSPSFVPPPSIRELRDLTRQRAQLIADKAAVANRVHKTLEGANIKLSSVATDILGVSGRAMITRLIQGETDPNRLAEEARSSLKKKVIPLRRAMEGRVTEHHRFLLQALMDQLRQLEDLIERYGARIEEAMRPFAEAEKRLMTIPGVGRQAAEVIVAEIGADMTRFATAGHLASWSGLCPGNNESAGKRRTGRTTKGSQWLRTTLVQVAWAASHTKKTIFGATYHRWIKRLGKKKALIAVARKILELVHFLLKNESDYLEKLPPVVAA
jgi:transposase